VNYVDYVARIIRLFDTCSIGGGLKALAYAAYIEHQDDTYISQRVETLLESLAEMCDHLEDDYMSDVPWRDFLCEVGLYLELESSEPDGNPADLFEFMESLWRAYRVILHYNEKFSAYESEYKATGTSRTIRLNNVWNAWAFALKDTAQFFGEGVGRAGEDTPRIWGSDMGSGDYPWSVPS